MGTFTTELTFGQYAYGTMAESPNISYKTLLYSYDLIASLFLSGAPGFWTDIQGTPQLYTDTAGTTAATWGDAVALVLDKSKGLVLGPELVTNGTFDSNINGWTTQGSTTAVWSNGAALINNVVAGTWFAENFRLSTPILTVGQTYEMRFSARNVSGTASLRVANNAAPILDIPSLPSSFQSYRLIFTCAVTNTFSFFKNGNTGEFELDNISVKLLPGNHLAQATAGNRPVYARHPKTGIRNLLVQTDTLSTQSVTVTAAAHTLSFKGTGTVTLSGTSTAGPLVGTGAGNRVTLTFTPTAGTLTLTVSGSVTEAQLELGSSATAYQKVTGWYDVTESGVPSVPYLYFNGTSTSMATSAIDFSAGDKMTVFAAVRKLSDAARGMLVELGVSPASGAFRLEAPGGAASNYVVATGGSSQTSATATPYAAPITSIITGIGSISTDQCVIRVNGSQAASSASDQGTGNYSNNPLYIGSRGGSGLYFKGNFYDLAIVAAELPVATIAAVETKLNSTVGAY